MTEIRELSESDIIQAISYWLRNEKKWTPEKVRLDYHRGVEDRGMMAPDTVTARAERLEPSS